MRLFSSDDLKGIMRKCAGMEDSIDLNGPVLDLSYTDMGYDSLAVLEIQAQIEHGGRMGQGADRNPVRPGGGRRRMRRGDCRLEAGWRPCSPGRGAPA